MSEINGADRKLIHRPRVLAGQLQEALTAAVADITDEDVAHRLMDIKAQIEAPLRQLATLYDMLRRQEQRDV